MSQNTAAELRVRLKESRKHFAAEDRQRASLLIRARLYTWLALMREHCESNNKRAPNVIAAFWPLTDEPDLIPLLERGFRVQFLVLVPLQRLRKLLLLTEHPEYV